jgi:hypothetical protein
VHVRVAEYGDGTPWIILEPSDSLERFGEELFFGLDLKPGTTYEQAKALVRALGDVVTDVSTTTFHNRPDPVTGKVIDIRGRRIGPHGEQR